ncbi:MAG: hypothetical protein AABY22_06900 [Nanoarchaeota archaeon]
MNWKDYRIFCEWCRKEIVMSWWNPAPDLNYYGKIFKGNGKYWHGYCAQAKLNIGSLTKL